MEKKLALRWHPRAQLDKESIAIYLGVEKRSPQAALKMLQNIDETLERLCLLSDMGGYFACEKLSNKDYRTAVVKPYIVFCRYDAANLTVYRIIHERFNNNDYFLIDLED